MNLTKTQACMVIEYFAQQAAEDYPDTTLPEQDKHMWMTRFQVSLAVERQIKESDWVELVVDVSAYESFDRDPQGWLHESGEDDTYKTRTKARWNLQDNVSGSIDNAWNNSGA